MADEPNGADLGIDVLGVKANVKNVKSLNTLLTFFVAVNVAVTVVLLYVHGVEAKDNNREIAKQVKESNKEIAETLKETSREQNTATRSLVRSINIQNCLTVRIRPDMTSQQRQEEKEFCERIT